MSDPIRMQVMWNRLLSVVEEQAQTLIRAAFSPIVRESGDISAGVFDMQGRMLAQAVTGTPGHINAMAEGVIHFINKYPVAEMEPGDVTPEGQVEFVWCIAATQPIDTSGLESTGDPAASNGQNDPAIRLRGLKSDRNKLKLSATWIPYRAIESGNK